MFTRILLLAIAFECMTGAFGIIPKKHWRHNHAECKAEEKLVTRIVLQLCSKVNGKNGYECEFTKKQLEKNFLPFEMGMASDYKLFLDEETEDYSRVKRWLMSALNKCRGQHVDAACLAIVGEYQWLMGSFETSRDSILNDLFCCEIVTENRFHICSADMREPFDWRMWRKHASPGEKLDLECYLKYPPTC